MSSDRSSSKPSTANLPTDLTVPPPSESPPSPIPDSATRKDPIFTDGHAPNQVFHFKALGISYGTDDKGHAAALLLSVAILVIIMILVIIGACLTDRGWLTDTLKVLGSAFLIVAGIAVGKSAGKGD